MSTTTPAETAKIIRATLKAEFSDIKFSVTSRSFSMGSEVNVRWTDGPTEGQVEDLIGHHGNGRHAFVMCNRSMSEATRILIEDHADPAEFARFIDYDQFCTPDVFALNVFHHPERYHMTSLGAAVAAIRAEVAR